MSSRELKATVSGLFATFSRYRIDDFHGCPCCVTQEDCEKLAHKPLRELTYDDLLRYSSKAISTWGEPRHFKYFLPRLFELTIESRDEFLDLAVVYGKLESAKFTSWPETEQRAVKQFFDAYWQYQLDQAVNGPYNDTIDTVLCAISKALGSADDLLSLWLKTNSTHAKQHLAAFVNEYYDSLISKGRLSNPFWDYSGQAHRKVVDWLCEEATFKYLKSLDCSEFSDACYCLDAIRELVRSST